MGANRWREGVFGVPLLPTCRKTPGISIRALPRSADLNHGIRNILGAEGSRKPQLAQYRRLELAWCPERIKVPTAKRHPAQWQCLALALLISRHLGWRFAIDSQAPEPATSTGRFLDFSLDNGMAQAMALVPPCTAPRGSRPRRPQDQPGMGDSPPHSLRRWRRPCWIDSIAGWNIITCCEELRLDGYSRVAPRLPPVQAFCMLDSFPAVRRCARTCYAARFGARSRRRLNSGQGYRLHWLELQVTPLKAAGRLRRHMRPRCSA